MLTKFAANSVTKPGSSPVFTNPRDLGLNYKDVTFKASDGVTLSGWLLKGRTNKVIILSHFGIYSSRSGYTRQGKGMIGRYHKDISFLEMAKHLVDNGYNVLMYDFRNHGNSAKGTCEWITGGVEEQKDVIAAVKFISTHKEYQDSPIGLLSLCMGANATTLGFGSKNGLQNYKNIKAFTAVQPTTNSGFLKAFGFSEKRIKKANELNLKRGGKDLEASCLPNVKKITVPTMVVQGKGDPWADLDWVKSYYEKVPTEKEMFWIEGANKRLDAYDWFNHTPERMLDFFRKYL